MSTEGRLDGPLGVHDLEAHVRDRLAGVAPRQAAGALAARKLVISFSLLALVGCSHDGRIDAGLGQRAGMTPEPAY